jgi:hypothetical protein
VIRLSNAWEYNGINVVLRKGSVNLIKDIVATSLLGLFTTCLKLNDEVNDPGLNWLKSPISRQCLR